MVSTQNGNQFGKLVKSKSAIIDFNVEECQYIGKTDKRMRFNNAQDPIYYIFDVIENRPVKTLAKEFVKDSILDVISFVSKVVC